LRRADFKARHPVHVTLRLQPAAGYLRAGKRARAIERSLRAAREQLGVRVVHYSIQGNHLHLIVEAQNRAALARATQGLAIRIARALNALTGAHGSVFADRYHARALVSRREVRNAVRYVLQNYRHHAREQLPARWIDPLSSAEAPVALPRTWLLRVGWRAR
jgi:REP element-mobilizing transposase RayT